MMPPSSSGGDTPGTVVVALGGNALQPPGERGEIHEQFAHARQSLTPIVALAREGWRIAIVHGNGPQIGDELVRNESARSKLPPLPLGVLDASTAGWIGYMVQQSLENALGRAGVDRDVVTLITQVLVDADDPAMRDPEKPIGRTMDEATAQTLARETGWTVGPVGDADWRRLVASPRPLEIVEREQIGRLVDAGTIVIAAGGGGTPVYRDPGLGLEGVDAVVDKDRASHVLARGINAGVLLILTNVDAAYRSYGTPEQERLDVLTPGDAERLLNAGEFGRGSMAPKIEAAVRFVRECGGRAHIARLDQGMDAVEGNAGTMIVERS